MDYLNEYENIITKARSKNRIKGQGIYYENHHIFPSCWCKDDLEYLKKEKINLVLLTAKEHFMAHRWLAKEFGGGMWFAFFLMCAASPKRPNFNYKVEVKLYEEARIESAKVASKNLKGRKRSEETKRKMSEFRKGIIPSEETRKKMSLAHIGNIAWNKGKINVYSKETRMKISKSLKGRKRKPITEETRIRMIIAAKKRKGIIPSEETRKKMSLAHIGRKFSYIRRSNISKALKGRNLSEETKKKISESKMGCVPWNKGKHYLRGKYKSKEMQQ